MIITSGQTVKTFVSSAYQCQPSFVRKHGFEYINLREVEDNPIVGKYSFWSLKMGKCGIHLMTPDSICGPLSITVSFFCA